MSTVSATMTKMKETVSTTVTENLKSSQTQQAPADFVISEPRGMQHQGHIGIDTKSGIFEVRNLPPDLSAFFQKLDNTLKSMGQRGLTVREAQMLLSAASETESTVNSPLSSSRGRSQKNLPTQVNSPPVPQKPSFVTTQSSQKSITTQTQSQANFSPASYTPENKQSPWKQKREKDLEDRVRRLEEEKRNLEIKNSSLSSELQYAKRNLEDEKRQKQELEDTNRRLDDELADVKLRVNANLPAGNKGLELELQNLKKKLTTDLDKAQKKADEETKLRNQLEDKKRNLENELADLKIKLRGTENSGDSRKKFDQDLKDLRQKFNLELDEMKKKIG